MQVSLATAEEVTRQQHYMDNVTRLKEAMREDRVILHTQKLSDCSPIRSSLKAFTRCSHG